MNPLVERAHYLSKLSEAFAVSTLIVKEGRDEKLLPVPQVQWNVLFFVKVGRRWCHHVYLSCDLRGSEVFFFNSGRDSGAQWWTFCFARKPIWGDYSVTTPLLHYGPEWEAAHSGRPGETPRWRDFWHPRKHRQSLCLFLNLCFNESVCACL